MPDPGPDFHVMGSKTNVNDAGVLDWKLTDSGRLFATVAWLDAAFRLMAEFANPAFPARLRQPMLMVAGGRDRLVSTPAIEDFGSRLSVGSHLILPGAMHEVLMEQDPFREQFWAAFDAYVPGTPLF